MSRRPSTNSDPVGATETGPELARAGDGQL